MINKQYILGGTIVAATAIALGWGIKKIRKAKKVKQVKRQKYNNFCKEHEETVQHEMEFMNSKEAMVNAEFDRFRNLITDEDRVMFDDNYEALRDIMLENGVSVIKANEIGTMFLASVVLRNNIEKQHFSDHTRFMLEGNAELLPGAIREALNEFEDEVIDEAIDYGRTAMDMVITGVSREEFLYANYH